MHSSALSQLSKRSMTCDPLSYSLASLQQALRFAGSIIFPISSLPSEAHQLNWSAFLSKINKLNSFFLFLLIKVACLKLKVPVPQSAQTWSVRPSACGHNWNTIRIRLRKWSNFSLNFKRWKIWFFFSAPYTASCLSKTMASNAATSKSLFKHCSDIAQQTVRLF